MSRDVTEDTHTMPNCSLPQPSLEHNLIFDSPWRAREVDVSTQMPPSSDVGEGSSTTGRQHIPRPANCYILFRRELRKAYVPPPGKKADERARSKFTSNLWNNMSREEKAPWREKARLIKEAHKIKYPDYRYKPKRKIPIKEASDLGKKKQVEEKASLINNNISLNNYRLTEPRPYPIHSMIMAPFFPQQMNAGLQQVGQTPSSYLTGGLARGVSEYNSYERGPSATPMASVLGPLYPSYVQSSSQNLGVSNQLDPYGNIQRIQTPVGTQRGSQVYPSQYPYPPPYSS